MSKPLTGTTVIDFTSSISGPFCGALLADYGAEVIKVERPVTGEDARLFPPIKDGTPLGFVSIGRGKKAISIDLNKEEGQNIFQKIASKVDVILENYTPGTMKRWNIDFDTIKQINPKIVYCSISGYGQFGPMAQLPSYDIVVQGLSGMMAATGFPDGPPTKTGSALSDYITGIFGAFAISMGLLYVKQHQEAIHLDVSMLDVLLSIQDVPFLNWTNNNAVTPRFGNRLPYVTPFDTFEASDGWIIIAAANNNNFGALCQVMNRPDLLDDPRFSDNARRCQNEAELKPIINDFTKKHTLKELLVMLQKNGVPCSPIQHIGQILDSPHAKIRGMVQEVTQPNGVKVKVPGIAVKINGEVLQVTGGAPDVGQHNKELFSDWLGYTEEQLEELKNKKII